jgi:hypothetical protein
LPTFACTARPSRPHWICCGSNNPGCNHCRRHGAQNCPRHPNRGRLSARRLTIRRCNTVCRSTRHC